MSTTVALDRGSLSRVVVVANGKGGVGKTSVTTNVGAELAAQGHRVLIVDFDVSGNVEYDLGLKEHQARDLGRGTVDAVLQNGTMKPSSTGRDRLDVVFGGPYLEMFSTVPGGPLEGMLTMGNVGLEFARKIADVAGDYDLVLIDCPPGNATLLQMALTAARWVLVPTKTDLGSLGGLTLLGPRVAKARETNPDLSYLGIVLMFNLASATEVMEAALAELEPIAGQMPVFETVIRHSESGASRGRRLGLVARELPRAGGLAADYAELAKEIKTVLALSVFTADLTESVVAL